MTLDLLVQPWNMIRRGVGVNLREELDRRAVERARQVEKLVESDMLAACFDVGD